MIIADIDSTAAILRASHDASESVCGISVERVWNRRRTLSSVLYACCPMPFC